MTPDELRKALHELRGDRDLALIFADIPHPVSGVANLLVKNAMLIPDEPDHLVKVTDGKAIYILDAERIAWIKIG